MLIALFISIFILINVCQVIEVYAYIIKGSQSESSGRQLIGLANLMQYVARIAYVIVLLCLSLAFEVYNARFEILLIIVLSFSMSAVVSYFLSCSLSFQCFFNKLISPFSKYSYPNVVVPCVIVKMSNVKIDRHFLLAFFSSILLGLAFVLPFVVASTYPNYRMIATYSGQFLNFFATAIIFSSIEPKIFSELDNKKFNESSKLCDSAISTVYAKVSSQVLLSLLIGILYVWVI